MLSAHDARRLPLLLALLLLPAACAEKKEAPPAPAPPLACADMACLLEAASACRPAAHLASNEVEVFGLQQRATTHFLIEGPRDGACVMTRRLEKLSVTVSDEMRKRFQEKGMSDEAIRGIEEQAFAKVKEAGRDAQRCVMAPDALRRALKQESEGVYEPTAWHGCRPPPAKAP